MSVCVFLTEAAMAKDFVKFWKRAGLLTRLQLFRIAAHLNFAITAPKQNCVEFILREF